MQIAIAANSHELTESIPSSVSFVSPSSQYYFKYDNLRYTIKFRSNISEQKADTKHLVKVINGKLKGVNKILMVWINLDIALEKRNAFLDA